MFATAVNEADFVVVQYDKASPKFDEPELEKVTPAGIVNVSPLSPKAVDVPLPGVILFTFIVVIGIYI